MTASSVSTLTQASEVSQAIFKLLADDIHDEQRGTIFLDSDASALH
ncbi:MAG: hypothetical protein QOD28_2560 [Acidobacteriota bacterium]|nr:hypothetical protein [Acidobacteriota bacterium]